MSRPVNAKRELIGVCDGIVRTYLALDTDGENDICIWKDERFTYEDKFGMSTVSYKLDSDGYAIGATLNDIVKSASFAEITTAFRDRVSHKVKSNITEIRRRFGNEK